MISIGCLNVKGGVGKTTLASTLAVLLSGRKDTRVAVADLDPQQTFADWYARRGSPDNPVLLRGAERASEAVEDIASSGLYDFVILDGPPMSVDVTRDAIQTADFVLIPTSITAFDLGSTLDCVEMCHKAGAPYLVVINNVTHYDAPAVREARRGLIEMSARVAETVIRRRVPYYNATIAGLTGLEQSKDAKTECRALWAEIESMLPTVGDAHGQE